MYPTTSEDLQGPCLFEMRLPAPGVAVAGTLVVYQRGDTQQFYDDTTVQAAMTGLNFAMVFAEECDAQTTGSFQADASKGPATVLFAALSQLAVSSGHPELATSNVALFGFSAGGVLSASMLNEAPSRILGAIEYAPGDAHVNLATLPVSAAAAQIPALILANALDEKSGTTRGLTYYTRGRNAGAPWAYGVQHATDHCCSLSTRSVALPWLAAVIGAGSPASPLPLKQSAFVTATYGTFTCTPNDTVDVFGQNNCAFSVAALQPVLPVTGTYGWLPDAASGAAWVTWVLNPATN